MADHVKKQQNGEPFDSSVLDTLIYPPHRPSEFFQIELESKNTDMKNPEQMIYELITKDGDPKGWGRSIYPIKIASVEEIEFRQFLGNKMDWVNVDGVVKKQKIEEPGFRLKGGKHDLYDSIFDVFDSIRSYISTDPTKRDHTGTFGILARFPHLLGEIIYGWRSIDQLDDVEGLFKQKHAEILMSHSNDPSIRRNLASTKNELDRRFSVIKEKIRRGLNRGSLSIYRDDNFLKKRVHELTSEGLTQPEIFKALKNEAGGFGQSLKWSSVGSFKKWIQRNAKRSVQAKP